MVKIRAALLMASLAPGAFGATWTVCVEGSGELLNTPLRGAVLREFRELMGGRGADLGFGTCVRDSRRIRLEIQDEPPDHLDGVLGLAYRRSERIEPRLKVFYGPLVRYIGDPNSTQLIGRAIARVAAHEAMHFLEQQPEHCADGLMRPEFSVWELLGSDRGPFRPAHDCKAVDSRESMQGLRSTAGRHNAQGRDRRERGAS